ncbi:MAG TPA: MaoC family dehydratase N-terminal domain-containing protein, partial [Acidimicrobiales bacterium]|nr:MaoC family dehydratase N-terminal domain-containing protein [Acidimicrobiales bacterium]
MAEPLFDTTDVDRWVGVPLGGGFLKDPVHPNDIRRWAQGMQNPNPLHYDDAFAGESRFGRLVAPQSFSVATDVGHGATPSIQGTVPGSHMIFGGDEWWFFGPRIEPGDRIKQERMLFDYKVTETKFAGPTMFSRGDTTYINDRGEMIAKQRSTSIRYLAEEARKRAQFSEQEDPVWSDEALDDL